MKKKTQKKKSKKIDIPYRPSLLQYRVQWDILSLKYLVSIELHPRHMHPKNKNKHTQKKQKKQ